MVRNLEARRKRRVRETGLTKSSPEDSERLDRYLLVVRTLHAAEQKTHFGVEELEGGNLDFIRVAVRENAFEICDARNRGVALEPDLRIHLLDDNAIEIVTLRPRVGLEKIFLPALRRELASRGLEARALQMDVQPMASDATPTAPTMQTQSQAENNSRECVFQKEGTYWRITYSTKPFIIQDLVGVQGMITLLQNPNKDFTSIELSQIIAKNTGGKGDVDETELREGGLSVSASDDGDVKIDHRAMQEYRNGLAEIKEEKERATVMNNFSQIEKLEDEGEKIAEQLKSATGLGGRQRRFDGNTEKERVGITQRINAAIGKIKKQDSTLGAYLEVTIETGRHFTYRPENAEPIQLRILP